MRISTLIHVWVLEKQYALDNFSKILNPQFDVCEQDPRVTLHYLHRMLLTSKHHIQNDAWAGIPELTNENGGYCGDSCNTQAWSASTLLDFLEIVHQMHAPVVR